MGLINGLNNFFSENMNYETNRSLKFVQNDMGSFTPISHGSKTKKNINNLRFSQTVRFGMLI